MVWPTIVSYYSLVMDFLVLNFYLGCFVFSIGSMLFVVLIKKVTNNRILLVFFLLLQFVISFILSLLFWRHWIFDFDIMFGFISIPAILGEMVSIILFCIVIPWIIKQTNKGNS